MAHRNIEISASVICVNWLNAGEQICKLETLGIDYLHFDVMDGIFVNEFSFGPLIINQIRESSSIPSDYHIMVEEPRRTFEHYAREEGAIISLHYEACRNLHRELVTLRKMGFRPGLVLNPATTLENIEYVIEEVDRITIMTVNPGYVGAKLIPQTLEKIKRLKEWRDRVGFEFKIAVDGNVSFNNIPRMVANGADTLIVGTSGLFVRGQSLDDSYTELIRAIDMGLKEGEHASNSGN